MTICGRMRSRRICNPMGMVWSHAVRVSVR